MGVGVLDGLGFAVDEGVGVSLPDGVLVRVWQKAVQNA